MSTSKRSVKSSGPAFLTVTLPVKVATFPVFSKVNVCPSSNVWAALKVRVVPLIFVTNGLIDPAAIPGPETTLLAKVNVMPSANVCTEDKFIALTYK